LKQVSLILKIKKNPESVRALLKPPTTWFYCDTGKKYPWLVHSHSKMGQFGNNGLGILIKSVSNKKEGTNALIRVCTLKCYLFNRDKIL